MALCGTCGRTLAGGGRFGNEKGRAWRAYLARVADTARSIACRIPLLRSACKSLVVLFSLDPLRGLEEWYAFGLERTLDKPQAIVPAVAQLRRRDPKLLGKRALGERREIELADELLPRRGFDNGCD